VKAFTESPTGRREANRIKSLTVCGRGGAVGRRRVIRQKRVKKQKQRTARGIFQNGENNWFEVQGCPAQKKSRAQVG